MNLDQDRKMMGGTLHTGTATELARYKEIWKGGYFGGDPLDPVGAREYGDMSLISVNHALYLAYVRPFIQPDTRVLEIGPGRGAWTRAMLGAREIWCADALSAEHNGFWNYVGIEHAAKIHYREVSDFSLSFAPDGYFDFIFSFGAFCHITPEGQREYFKNAFAKARPGAQGVVMVADFDKFNAAYAKLSELRTMRVSFKGLKDSLRFNVGYWMGRLKGNIEQQKSDRSVTPGRFYHAGVAETCAYLESVGWRVVTPDVGLNLRDVVIHFERV